MFGRCRRRNRFCLFAAKSRRQVPPGERDLTEDSTQYRVLSI